MEDHRVDIVVGLGTAADLVAPGLQASVLLHGLAVVGGVEAAAGAEVVLCVPADAPLRRAVVLARAAVCRNQHVAHRQRDVARLVDRRVELGQALADGVVALNPVAEALRRGAGDEDVVEVGGVAVLVVGLQH